MVVCIGIGIIRSCIVGGGGIIVIATTCIIIYRRGVIVRIIIRIVVVVGIVIIALLSCIVSATPLGIIFLIVAVIIVAVHSLLASCANVVIVIPSGISLREGIGDLLGKATLAAVEWRAEGDLHSHDVLIMDVIQLETNHSCRIPSLLDAQIISISTHTLMSHTLLLTHLVTQKVSIQIIPITIELIVLATIDFRALFVGVYDKLKLRRRIGSAMLTSDFGVEWIFALGSFLEHDALKRKWRMGGKRNKERMRDMSRRQQHKKEEDNKGSCLHSRIQHLLAT